MISVVITVYKQPNTLRWLLSSLATQYCAEPVEVLVCDDGSIPMLAELAQDAADRFDLDLHYIWQPDKGFRAARSRNNGIREARGETLVFLDGDIVPQQGFLEAHRRTHKGGGKILACGTRRAVRSRITEGQAPPVAEWSLRPDSPIPLEQARQHSWLQSRFPWMTMLSCNFSIRRGDEVHFDEAFVGWGSEDREFAIRMWRRGYELRIAPDAECFHVSLPGDQGGNNPIFSRKHADVVALIRNKLYLRHLYPDQDLRPGLELLLTCFLDPASDRWSMNRPTEPRQLDDVIRMAESWMNRHDIAFLPAPVGERETLAAAR